MSDEIDQSKFDLLLPTTTFEVLNAYALENNVSMDLLLSSLIKQGLEFEKRRATGKVIVILPTGEEVLLGDKDADYMSHFTKPVWSGLFAPRKEQS